MMDPAVQLVAMRQGKRALEDHIKDFLDIAHLSDLLGFALIDFFFYGLNQPIKHKLIRDGPRGLLAMFLD